MKKKTTALLACITVLLSSGVTYLITTRKYKREIEFCRDNADLITVYDDIKDNYYKEISKEQLLDYMIKGCVDACDEEYNVYSTSNMIDEGVVNGDSSVTRSGFAVEKTRHDQIRVTEVKEGSRAEEMGLQVGDIITSVDGVDVVERGYYEAIRDLLGKDGTKMMLHIRRENDTELDIEFIRDNTKPDTEKNFYHEIMNDDILYIKFAYFDENMLNQIEKTIAENEHSSMIIDLRGNGGGEIQCAVDFFDLFAKEGSRVTEKYERTGKEEVRETSTDGNELECPVVVLANGSSVSAAEITTALFKDTGRGTVVGEKTKGKAIFQVGNRLSNMLMYRYTAGYCYVNDLPHYDGVGVYPDITVEMNEELILTKDDIQLEKAIELLG